MRPPFASSALLPSQNSPAALQVWKNSPYTRHRQRPQRHCRVSSQHRCAGTITPPLESILCTSFVNISSPRGVNSLLCVLSICISNAYHTSLSHHTSHPLSHSTAGGDSASSTRTSRAAPQAQPAAIRAVKWTSPKDFYIVCLWRANVNCVVWHVLNVGNGSERTGAQRRARVVSFVAPSPL